MVLSIILDVAFLAELQVEPLQKVSPGAKRFYFWEQVKEHFLVLVSTFISNSVRQTVLHIEACKTGCKLASAESDSPRTVGACATDRQYANLQYTLITVSVPSSCV